MGIGIAPLVPPYVYFWGHFWTFQPKVHLGNCVLKKIFLSMLVEKRKNVFPARQNNYFPNSVKDNFPKHWFLVFLDKFKILFFWKLFSDFFLHYTLLFLFTVKMLVRRRRKNLQKKNFKKINFLFLSKTPKIDVLKKCP